jgi:hypothetical protein
MSFPPDLAVGDSILYFQTVPIKHSRLSKSFFANKPHWNSYRNFQGLRLGRVTQIAIGEDGARTLTIQNPPEDPGRQAMATPVSRQWPGSGDEYDYLTEVPKAERIVMKPSMKALQVEQIMRGSEARDPTKPGAASLPPELKNKILAHAGLGNYGNLYRRALNGDPTLLPRKIPCSSSSSSSSCTISRKSNRKRTNKTRRTQRTKQNRY